MITKALETEALEVLRSSLGKHYDEEAGAAWLVMLRVLARYDPKIGPLAYVFRKAWKFARIDRARLRDTEARKIRQLTPPPVLPEHSEHEKDLVLSMVLRKVRPDDMYFLLFANSHTYAQTAAAFGIRPNTVKTRMHRTRQRIRAPLLAVLPLSFQKRLKRLTRSSKGSRSQ